MIYNNDIQYNNERTNRTRMFMSHPHDFSKTPMIQSLYLVRLPCNHGCEQASKGERDSHSDFCVALLHCHAQFFLY